MAYLSPKTVIAMPMRPMTLAPSAAYDNIFAAFFTKEDVKHKKGKH